jgi:hypothetical protein
MNSWFLLPKKTIEIAEPAIPDAGIIETISSGISVISLATTYMYQYDKYIKLSKFSKWLIFGFVTVHLIALGSVVYLLLKQEGVKDKVSYGVSKYCLPILYVVAGIFYIISMSVNRDKVSAYRILNVINDFLNLADFGPIHETMKTQPEIYYPVHGIRVLLKNAEGATLLAEIAGTKEEPGTQPALA